MLHKTRGIVFQVTDFRETSVVAKIYTELFGLQGYIINSVRKKNARIRQNALHPLSLVDLVVYHKTAESSHKGLHRIAEIRPNPVLQNIPFDVRKSSIALFLDEVLCKAIKEEESNPLMFDFLFQSVQLLDLQTPVNNDFHIYFLMWLTKYLGFFPQVGAEREKGKKGEGEEAAGAIHPTFSDSYFNLQEGIFQFTIPIHPYYVEPPLTDVFKKVLQSPIQLAGSLGITVAEKRMLTEKILEYYQLHLPSFPEIKSRKVLEEVWS